MGSLKRSYQEKTLLKRVHTQKDADAFASIYDAYIEKIYRFVLFKIGTKEEAEDITSTVFLNIWKYLISEKGRNVKSLSGLLYTTARRLVVDAYRSRAKKQTQSLDDIDVADTQNLLEAVHVSEQHRIIMKSLKQLKREYQEVIVLRYVDELSIKEIAAVIQKKQTNVRVLLHRATKKLQDLHISE